MNRFTTKLSSSFEVDSKLETLKESLQRKLRTNPGLKLKGIEHDLALQYNYELLCDGITFRVSET